MQRVGGERGLGDAGQREQGADAMLLREHTRCSVCMYRGEREREREREKFIDNQIDD